VLLKLIQLEEATNTITTANTNLVKEVGVLEANKTE
jgi:hypothetical protein